MKLGLFKVILIKLKAYGKPYATNYRKQPMNNINVSRLDVAELLNDEATIEAYLNEILLDGTPQEFIQALDHIARARGMNEIAQKTGIGRTTLYKTLQSEKPRFESLAKILESLGLKIQVVKMV